MSALSNPNVEQLLEAAEKAIAALRAAVVGSGPAPEPRAPHSTDLISPAEAAERFRVSAETVRRRCRRGEIGGLQGGRWQLSASEWRARYGGGCR